MLDTAEEAFFPLLKGCGMLPPRARFDVDFFPEVWLLIYVRLRRGWRLVLDPFGCYRQDGKPAFHLARAIELASLGRRHKRLEGKHLILGRKERKTCWRWEAFPYRVLTPKEIAYWQRGLKSFSQAFVSLEVDPIADLHVPPRKKIKERVHHLVSFLFP